MSRSTPEPHPCARPRRLAISATQHGELSSSRRRVRRLQCPRYLRPVRERCVGLRGDDLLHFYLLSQHSDVGLDAVSGTWGRMTRHVYFVLGTAYIYGSLLSYYYSHTVAFIRYLEQNLNTIFSSFFFLSLSILLLNQIRARLHTKPFPFPILTPPHQLNKEALTWAKKQGTQITQQPVSPTLSVSCDTSCTSSGRSTSCTSQSLGLPADSLARCHTGSTATLGSYNPSSHS